MLKTDVGQFTRIRKVRGQLISRPRKKSQKPYIKAGGRADWVGWCELIKDTVNEIAIQNLARMIRDINADVLALIEVESRPVLVQFNEMMAHYFGTKSDYRHIMVIDGNDDRGIDVGLATQEGYPIGLMRSHVDDVRSNRYPIFSRDCPEYYVTLPSGEQVVFLPNHFKSKYGGNDKASRQKRFSQATAVADYYQRLVDEGFENVVVLGDLNDTPDSSELAPLIGQTSLADVSEHPKFTDIEFRSKSKKNRGIGTHGLGNDRDKIDYILLSPSLYDKVTNGGIFRKGVWPGVRPARWKKYPELTAKQHAASDHHMLWVDIGI